MKNIKELLEKFYLGQTSDEEDYWLKNYFSQENIPTEFEQDKQYFDYLSKAAKVNYLDDSFDEKIINAIEGKKVKSIKKIQKIINIAAIIVVIIGFYFITKNYNFIKPNKNYTTQEIKGMVITINTFNKLSKYLNKSNESLQNLEKLNQAFDKLNELDKINKYNISN